jgi:hypothetical protein
MDVASDNPYAAPVESGVVTPPRNDFPEIDTKALKKLRNDSHSIRTVAALLILGIGILGIVLVFASFSGNLGIADLILPLGITAFQGIVVAGLIVRATWGRVLGFISGALMLIGFPIGTLIGVLFLIALARADRLFGSNRFTHKALEAEWKYRKKFKVP